MRLSVGAKKYKRGLLLYPLLSGVFLFMVSNHVFSSSSASDFFCFFLADLMCVLCFQYINRLCFSLGYCGSKTENDTCFPRHTHEQIHVIGQIKKKP